MNSVKEHSVIGKLNVHYPSKVLEHLKLVIFKSVISSLFLQMNANNIFVQKFKVLALKTFN